jgi:hypothetical protein
MSSKKITIDLTGDDLRYTTIMLALIGSKRNSMIDLCCNLAPHTRTFGFKERVYVDVLPRDLGNEQKNFVQADVLGDHPVLSKHYDVSICSDGIEHVLQEQGEQLLVRMKAISDRQVLFTPLDPWMMSPDDPNPESHKSIWNPGVLPDYAHVVMPNYHPTLGIGAFFFWNCDGLDEDFERVRNLLESSPVFKNHVSV